jgi:uridine kinase
MNDMISITAGGPPSSGKTTLLRFIMLQLAEYGVLADDDIAAIAKDKEGFLSLYRKSDRNYAEGIEIDLDRINVSNLAAAMDRAAIEPDAPVDYFDDASCIQGNVAAGVCNTTSVRPLNRVVVEHNVDGRVIDALGWLSGGLSSAFSMVEKQVASDTDEVMILISRQ